MAGLWEAPGKLPLPALEKTLEWYLEDLQVIEEDEVKYEETKRHCDDYLQSGRGVAAQRKLEVLAEENDCWVHDLWLNDMYMTLPLALPINSNPGMMMAPKLCYQTRDEWLWRSARLVRGALHFKELIDDERLEQDRSRQNNPLCMRQYKNLFYCYRRAGSERDERVVAWPYEARCILVAARRSLFLLDVYSSSNRVRPLSLIYADLREIMRAPLGAGTGVLTTLARREWGAIRERIESQSTLEKIEKCLFVLCLDEIEDDKDDDDDDDERMRRAIHGNASCNRWYEQSFQLISASDGVVALNYEHSIAEGLPLVTMIECAFDVMQSDDALDKDETPACSEQHASSNTNTIEHVQLHLGNQDESAIADAQARFEKACDDADVHVERFSHFGKTLVKRLGQSPDCFVQVALQLAYFQAHNRLSATYESASIRAFRRGRVDVIRAATRAAKNLALPHNESGAAEEALKRQTQVMKSTVTGYGMDNHLIALRAMSAQDEPLFAHSSFERMMHFALSTSQVPTRSPLTCMGYGAVVPDGYGVSYNIHDDCITFSVASFASCEKSESSKRFSQRIVDAMLKLRDLLQ